MSNSHPLHRILLPLDGSELATTSIPYARALATDDTELVLFRAVPDPTPLMELAGTSAYPVERIRKNKLEETDAYLRAVADVLRDATLQTSTVSSVGDPPEEILKVADQQAVDLVVMASHGRGFLGRVVVGSVADKVARAATVPVMLLHSDRGTGPPRAGDAAHIERIVVPLDGSDRAGQALPVAAGLARRFGCTIHLVRAIPTREELTALRDSIDSEYYEGYTSAISDELASEASRLEANGATATSEVVIGPAAPSILDVITDHDIIVMTSHGLGGVRRWLMGSMAERLVHGGTAPVVLVPVAERRELTDARPDDER